MNFDEWWNEDYNDSENPFEKNSFGYWAYAGWCAAMQALREESVQSEGEWVGLTDEEIIDWWESDNKLENFDMTNLFDFARAVRTIQAKLKEKNYD